jgi:hypothetical protein
MRDSSQPHELPAATGASLYQAWRALQVRVKEQAMIRTELTQCALAGVLLVGAAGQAESQDRITEQPKAAEAAAQTPESGTPEGLTKLSEKNDVWLDTKRKAVVVDGQVCLRAGQLEMFACPKGTKEHESVVSLNCMAEEVHAGLLAAGGKPGKPVSFNPEYKVATGQIIDVYVLWKDAQGNKNQARAQDWVKQTRTGKPMSQDWVFAGSGFWKDPETGQEHYLANGGDLICLSNFPTAMLDLPIESSQANAELMFEALTDNIPPKGTKVRMVLIPRAAKVESAAAREPNAK